MRIVQTYSHLNGEEFLLVHHKSLYSELKKVIREVDASKFRSKTSREKTMPGKKLFDHIALNAEFKLLLHERG